MAKAKRTLNATLYCYIEPKLAKYAREKGFAKFGSFSAFINYLLAKDAGDKKAMARMKEFAKSKLSPKMAKRKGNPRKMPSPGKKKNIESEVPHIEGQTS